jgi:hypothetical protein
VIGPGDDVYGFRLFPAGARGLDWALTTSQMASPLGAGGPLLPLAWERQEETAMPYQLTADEYVVGTTPFPGVHQAPSMFKARAMPDSSDGIR